MKKGVKLQDNNYILTVGTSELYRSREFIKMDAIMNYYPEMKNKLDIYCSVEVMIIKK